MIIRHIEVRKFRGLETFSAIVNEGMLILVGQNDVGKSTVLRAIRIFLEDEKPIIEDFPRLSLNSEIEIEIHFLYDGLNDFKHDDLIKIKQIIKNDGKKVSVEKKLFRNFPRPTEDELNDYNTLKTIGASLGVEFPKRKPAKANEIEELKTRVVDNIDSMEPYSWTDVSKEAWVMLQTLLPEVLFVPASQDHDNEQKMTNDSSVFGKLFRVGIRNWLKVDVSSKAAIETIEAQVKNINLTLLEIVECKLKEQTPLVEKIIQDIDPLDISKGFSFTMFIKDGQGMETPLSQRGSGLQRSVLIAILRAQNEINELIAKMSQRDQQESQEIKNTKIKPILYIIEEPEAFLHLAAQKELFYSLKDLAQNNGQVFMTTHSTLFMDEADMQDIVLLTRQEGKTFSLQHIPEERIKESLGEIRVSELLTGKVCCIVEGISDKQAISTWIRNLGYDHKRLGIHFITMDGCANAEYYANADILMDFNIPFVLILDTDNHGEGSR